MGRRGEGDKREGEKREGEKREGEKREGVGEERTNRKENTTKEDKHERISRAPNNGDARRHQLAVCLLHNLQCTLVATRAEWIIRNIGEDKKKDKDKLFPIHLQRLPLVAHKASSRLRSW